MTKASEELASLAERLEALAPEITEVADSAPSYDGQFGPKVRSLAAEGESHLGALSDHADALSTMLQVKAEEFAAADLQSESGFAGLQQSLRDWLQQAAALGPLAQFASLIGLDNLTARPASEEKEDGEPPWWAPALVWLTEGWYRAVIGAKGIAGIADITMDRAVEGGENLLNLIAITQYQQAQAQAMSAMYVADYLMRVQEPGFPADGPITPGFEEMAKTRPNGEPVSLVGSELAAIFATREVNVSFVGSGGSAPWAGRITVDEDYIDPQKMAEPFATGLVAHELTHLLQRELPDPYYWPPGTLDLEQPRRHIIGDSTNYMEVLSYIAGEAVEYDLLMEKDATGSLSLAEEVRVQTIENDLATFTGPDAPNATRYVVFTYNQNPIYRGSYVLELGLSDHRIPDGDWDHWFMQMGFSAEAVEHIRKIADEGTGLYVGEDLLDPDTGLKVDPRIGKGGLPTFTPTPSPTSTPSSTPSVGSIPSPSPTPQPPASSGAMNSVSGKPEPE